MFRASLSHHYWEDSLLSHYTLEEVLLQDDEAVAHGSYILTQGEGGNVPNSSLQNSQISSSFHRNSQYATQPDHRERLTLVELHRRKPWDRFLLRNYYALLSISKVFFGGFLWEGAALLAANNMSSDDHTFVYFLCTGLGDFLGVIFGQLLVISIIGTRNFKEVMLNILLLASASFCSGFTWQIYVNLCHWKHLTFTEAFFIVWALSGCTFFLAMTAFRQIYGKTIAKRQIQNWNIQMDFQLSFSVGCASAFFVGTSVGGEFDANWLEDLFGLAKEDIKPEIAMLKSGASTVLGFLVAQIAENCLPIDIWTDSH